MPLVPTPPEISLPEGVMVRVAGDTLALSPPLIMSEAEIGEIFDKVGRAMKAVG